MKMDREKVNVFLKEVEELCKKYDLSIAHQDGHGAFIIEKFDEFNIEWLKNAELATYVDEE